MTFYKCLLNLGLIAVLLSAWNLFHWTAFQDVVIEIKPKESRSPASIENPTFIQKQISAETIAIECGKEHQVETEFQHIRFRFLNCAQEPLVKNDSNHFQASLWSRKQAWISDYIPLSPSENHFAINANTRITVLYKKANNAKKTN